MTMIMVMLMCGETRVEILCSEHVFIHPINVDDGRGGGDRGPGFEAPGVRVKVLRAMCNEVNRVQRSHAVGLKYIAASLPQTCCSARSEVSVTIREACCCFCLISLVVGF